jgi:hypothetical protein
VNLVAAIFKASAATLKCSGLASDFALMGRSSLFLRFTFTIQSGPLVVVLIHPAIDREFDGFPVGQMVVMEYPKRALLSFSSVDQRSLRNTMAASSCGKRDVASAKVPGRPEAKSCAFHHSDRSLHKPLQLPIREPNKIANAWTGLLVKPFLALRDNLGVNRVEFVHTSSSASASWTASTTLS